MARPATILAVLATFVAGLATLHAMGGEKSGTGGVKSSAATIFSVKAFETLFEPAADKGKLFRKAQTDATGTVPASAFAPVGSRKLHEVVIVFETAHQPVRIEVRTPQGAITFG